MIHTTTDHHEQTLALLLPLASGVTILACLVRLRLDARKDRKDRKEKKP
jgi:hypothetical protein